MKSPKFWIGRCNLDLHPKCFTLSSPKGRSRGHREPTVGWEDRGEMSLWVHGRPQASLIHQKAKRDKSEGLCLLGCLLLQNQRELENLNALGSHSGPRERGTWVRAVTAQRGSSWTRATLPPLRERMDGERSHSLDGREKGSFFPCENTKMED